MVKKRRPWNIALTTFLIILVWVVGAWVSFFYLPIISDKQGIKYTVREGSSIRIVIDELHAQHVVKHPLLLRLLVRYKGVSHQLKAGEYLFPKGTTYPSLLSQLVTGSGMVSHPFMIVPGWSFKEVRAALNRNEYLVHTTQNLSDAQIMSQLGYPKLNPEGEFFPNTYNFSEGISDIVILKRAFKAMQEKLSAAWQDHAPNLPYKNAYQALIAASIIEKEAYLEKELPVIAGVLVNRLNTGMLLQFDPTVIYGLGDRYTGTIHRSDLLAKNAYNTYVNKGLPPTPISMPSLLAIQAVMHPMKHDFYYFVARGNGAHQFSKDLSTHYRAVEMAKKSQRFFNTDLTRRYLLKQFPQSLN